MVMEGQYTISSRNSSLEDGLVGRLLPNFSLLLPFQLSHAFDWTIICIEKMYAARTILGLCFCWPILMTPEGCLIRQPQSATRSGNYMRWYMTIFMFNRFIEPDPISFLGLWFQSIWFTNWHGDRDRSSASGNDIQTFLSSYCWRRPLIKCSNESIGGSCNLLFYFWYCLEFLLIKPRRCVITRQLRTSAAITDLRKERHW